MPVVLVVDDHVSIARAVQLIARQAGLEGVVVHDGPAALAYVRGGHPVAVMVLDVAMPGLSGLAVLRELAADGRLPALPVIMFSARAQDREESLRLGAVEFVLKDQSDELTALLPRYARPGADARATPAPPPGL